jgi:hypothetical protein
LTVHISVPFHIQWTDGYKAILGGLRSTSGAVFTTIFIAILNSKVKSQIANHVPQAAVAAGLPQSSLPALFEAIAAQSAAAYATVPGLTPQIQLAVSDALTDSYAAAFSYAYYAGTAIGCAAIIAAVFMKDYDAYLTGHIPKKVYDKSGGNALPGSNSQEKSVASLTAVDSEKGVVHHDEGSA